ncbi:MAG: hypothetical protein U9N51_03490 [Bacteroidota bacterium]|nr:hypothetical protein [Bacteroidota bacterium]
MRHVIFMLLISLIASTAFAFTHSPENDSASYYLDFVLNRRVYTKVEEMPNCKDDILEFISAIDFSDISAKPITDTHGEIVFIIEADGSIKQAWVENSINKAVDKQVIYQIKRHSKSWTIGKHNGKAVPVKIHYPFKLSKN